MRESVRALLGLLQALNLGLGLHLDTGQNRGDVVPHPAQSMSVNISKDSRLYSCFGFFWAYPLQADSLSKMIHVGKMLLPLVIKNPQHDSLL